MAAKWALFEPVPYSILAFPGPTGYCFRYQTYWSGMKANGKLSPELEDYLEAIFVLAREKGRVRVSDIARMVAVHKSTVTAALRSLAARELIIYSAYRKAELTGRGLRIARRVARNHEAIRKFLSEVLLLDDVEAEKNACRMEHVMDRAALQRLVQFAEFTEKHRWSRSAWKARSGGQKGKG